MKQKETKRKIIDFNRILLKSEIKVIETFIFNEKYKQFKWFHFSIKTINLDVVINKFVELKDVRLMSNGHLEVIKSINLDSG